MGQGKIVEAGEEPQGGGRIRRAPADPGGDRQALDQVEGPGPQALQALGEQAGGLEDEIVGILSGQRRGGAGEPRARPGPGSRLRRSPVPAKATKLSSR
jgi:hypothetical protein